MAKNRRISDNVHGLISCTMFEALIMNDPLFNRLHDVYQESTAYFTWPTNRTKRFEHSLGVMYLAGEMLGNAIEHSDPDVVDKFFAGYESEVWELLDGLSSDEKERLFKSEGDMACTGLLELWEKEGCLLDREEEDEGLVAYRHFGCDFSTRYGLPDCCPELIPSNIKSRDAPLAYMIVESVRLAGMLHDIGHPPFSHAVEHALMRVNDSLGDKSELCQAERDFKEHFGKFCSGGGKGKPHEVIGLEFADLLLRQTTDKLALKNDTAANEQLDALRVEYFVVSTFAMRILGDRGDLFERLHLLVDSVIDADRLDFINRDSLSSGFGSDSIVSKFIIDGIKLAKAGDDIRFAFSLKSIASLERVIKTRYHNYDTVVFHHRVQKSECLLDEIIKDLATRYFEAARKTEEAGGAEKGQRTYKIPCNISGLWSSFVQTNTTKRTRSLAYGQWNDSWFVFVLTSEYISLCEKKRLSKRDSLLRDCLAEFLFNEQHYYSMIKRTEDVHVVDREFRKLAAGDSSVAKKVGFIQEHTHILDGRENKAGRVDTQSSFFLTNATAVALINAYMGDSSRSDNDFSTTSPLIIASRSFEAIAFSKVYESMSFKSFIEECVKEFCQCNGIDEYFLSFDRPTKGIKSDSNTYLYDASGELFKLEETSRVMDILRLEELNKPPFFFFAHASKDMQEAGEGINLKRRFLEYLGKCLYGVYSSTLDEVSNGLERGIEAGDDPATVKQD